jgi:N6-adenosine-specific RNA methylase IME4
MNWPFGDLQPLCADLLLVDPPWSFMTYSEAGKGKSADQHYRCMAIEEVRALPVGQLARRDTLLLLWATWPLLRDALSALDAWGFTYASTIVWSKVFPSGKQAMGTGFRVRSMCEPILVATRGNPKHHPFPGLFKGLRREHSRKPEELYALINERCPGLLNRVELFARESRPGFVSILAQRRKATT